MSTNATTGTNPQTRVIDRVAATNILKTRALLGTGVTKDVPVTNVSFIDPKTQQPFEWEEDTSSAGQPYAIANFAIVNSYGKDKAIALFKEGNYADAVNTNLSLRVTPKLGKQLQEAMFATVVGAKRTVADDDGNDVETILIKKAAPMAAKSFEESMAFGADVFADPAEDSGAPQGGGSADGE